MSAHVPKQHGQNRAAKCPHCGMHTRRGGLQHHEWSKHKPEMTAAAEASYAAWKNRSSVNGGASGEG